MKHRINIEFRIETYINLEVNRLKAINNTKVELYE